MADWKTRLLPPASTRGLAVEFLFFAFSTAAFQVSRLGAGLVAAAILPPAAYSTWGLLLALLNYTVYANGGLLSGANREIPILIGARQVHDARAVEETAYAATIAISLAVALVAATISMLIGVPLALAIGVALTLGLQQPYLYCQVALRARLRFNAASLQQLLLAVVFPAVSLPLLGATGVAALAYGQLAAYILGVAPVLLFWRPELRPHFAWTIAIRLLRVGAPIMVGGLAFAVLTTIDRWLVLVLLGSTALGSYTVASLLSGGMLLISQVVAQQFYPRMAMRFGARAEATELMSMALRQGLAVLALLAPVIMLVGLGGPLVIGRLLPAYAGAVPALLILLIGYAVLLAGTGFWNLLIVVGKAHLYVALLVIAMLVEVAVAAMMVSIGWGITGVAVGAFVGFTSMTLAGAYVTWQAAQ